MEKFPNGFESWQETHFEIVSEITTRLLGQDDETFRARWTSKYHVNPDTNGMYELARKLTFKFEEQNEGREWDGEFFDVVEIFCTNELDND